MELYQLYNVAAANHIPVFSRPMPQCRSASVQIDGSCAIALDRSVQDCLAVEKTHLGHELGHCMTGSFYNVYSDHDVRQKHEIRADKWAIELLVPADQLDDAIAMGRTELWELAEYFHVTEAFMRKAVCYHTHGNLATELYF